MSASLVGSEMCIRDRLARSAAQRRVLPTLLANLASPPPPQLGAPGLEPLAHCDAHRSLPVALAQAQTCCRGADAGHAARGTLAGRA
eukprot:2937803-Alexandrium_andersonii.AAC.1